MPDLTEDALAPDVVVRRAAATEVQIRSDGDEVPLVAVGEGAVWARAEAGSLGVDLGHGSVNAVVRRGTVLFDARGGAGLVIVLRGEVDISVNGETVRRARAGEALSFDAAGQVGAPDPVDAAELAHDPFISLNLVLDALAGVSVRLPEAPASPGDEDEARRGRSMFSGGRGLRT